MNILEEIQNYPVEWKELKDIEEWKGLENSSKWGSTSIWKWWRNGRVCFRVFL